MANRLLTPINFVAFCAAVVFAMDLVGATVAASRVHHGNGATLAGALPLTSRRNSPSGPAQAARAQPLVIVIHSGDRPGDYIVVYAPPMPAESPPRRGGDAIEGADLPNVQLPLARGASTVYTF